MRPLDWEPTWRVIRALVKGKDFLFFATWLVSIPITDYSFQSSKWKWAVSYISLGGHNFQSQEGIIRRGKWSPLQNTIPFNEMRRKTQTPPTACHLSARPSFNRLTCK